MPDKIDSVSRNTEIEVEEGGGKLVKPIELKENAVHGTTEFPMALYHWEGEGYFPVPLHWHKETEIIYLVSGKFWLSVNMKEMRIEAPALIFIGAEEIHSIILEKDTRELAVVFDMGMLSFEEYDGIQYKIIRPLIDQKLQFPLVIDSTDAIWNEIRRAYEEVYEAAARKIVRQRDLGAYLRVKAGLYHILACLYEYGCFEDKVDMRSSDAYRIDTMKRVLNFIHDHCDQKLRVDEIAEVAGMNAQYFCRYFKRITGRTVTEYVNELRISQAARELTETNDKVIEIAMRCGYDNMGYFVRRFRQMKHMTPSEYRKKSKDGLG